MSEDFYDDDYDEDDCDHDNHDVDILIGRASCYRCGYTWYLTDEQLKEHFEFLERCHQLETEQHESGHEKDKQP